MTGCTHIIHAISYKHSVKCQYDLRTGHTDIDMDYYQWYCSNEKKMENTYSRMHGN